MKLIDSLLDYVNIFVPYIKTWDVQDYDDVVLDVPIYRQTHNYTCGPVAGAMILHAFHPNADKKAFMTEVGANKTFGTSTKKLRRTLRDWGVGTQLKRGLSIHGIVKAIDDGLPIIVTVQREDEYDLHWCVIYGYGNDGDYHVYIAGDNLTGSREYWSSFKSRWAPRGEGIICWGE